MSKVLALSLLLYALVASIIPADCFLDAPPSDSDVSPSEAVASSAQPSLLDDYVNCPHDSDYESVELPPDSEEEKASGDSMEAEGMPNISLQVPRIRQQEPDSDEEADLPAPTEGANVETDNTTDFDDVVESRNTAQAASDTDAEQSGDVGSTEDVDDMDHVGVGLKHIQAKVLYAIADNETRDDGFRKYLMENVDEVVLESTNYPDPYPDEVNEYRNFTVEGGRGVQITVHDLDIDPTVDFLYIRAGALDDSVEKGPILTGKIDEPLRFLIAHTTTFTLHFVSQHENTTENTHKGYRITYAPFGTVNIPTTPTTTEMIVPQEELQWTTKEIALTQAMIELKYTWDMVKEALSNASNQYIDKWKLLYQPSRPLDIKLLARKCPDTWRNYEECMRLEFAVPLRPIILEEEDEDEGYGFRPNFLSKAFIPLSTTEPPAKMYELSVENLDKMWEQFGTVALERIGIQAYVMPDNGRVLLIWIAISLCVVTAFIFVLYSIWKIDFLKDYRRISRLNQHVPEDDKNELKKKEYDIAMFPSPHQVVPTFFPTGDPFPSDFEAQYAYDNTTMNPWPEDFNHAPSVAPPGPRSSGATNQPYEPMSPLEYSPAVIDFNETPVPRRSTGKNNPFLSPTADEFQRQPDRR